jgi:hypothetical protein
MAFIRFIAGLLGFALLVAGTFYGIRGFWGVSRGDPGAWELALLGIGAVVVGGALMLPRAPRR